MHSEEFMRERGRGGVINAQCSRQQVTMMSQKQSRAINHDALLSTRGTDDCTGVGWMVDGTRKQNGREWLCTSNVQIADKLR